MIDFDRWAAKKASVSGENETDWKQRLDQYSQTGLLAKMTDGELERVLKSLGSLAQLDRLESTFTSEPQFMDRLFEACDASPFELSDWLEAFDQFLLWLESEKHSSKPQVMLGYLNCCVEFAKGKPQLETLTDMLKDMLQTHGFDGKIPQLRDN